MCENQSLCLIFCSLCITLGLDVLSPSDGEAVLEIVTTPGSQALGNHSPEFPWELPWLKSEDYKGFQRNQCVYSAQGLDLQVKLGATACKESGWEWGEDR